MTTSYINILCYLVAFFPTEIFKNLESNYAGFGRARRIIKTTHDEQILNISLDLCLEFGNGQAARKIVKFCQENFTEIDGADEIEQITSKINDILNV